MSALRRGRTGGLTRLLAVLFAMALLAAACGSDSADTDETVDAAPAANDDSTSAEPADSDTDSADEPEEAMEEDEADEPEEAMADDEADDEAMADESGEPIRIGGMFALSGPGSQVGQSANAALDIWIERVNSGGGINGQLVESVVIDTQSDPTNAVAAARRFVEEENVIAVMTAGIDPEIMATKDYLNENQMLTFAGTGCDCVYLDGVQEFIFKIPETQPVVLDFQMALAARDGITKLAWFGDNGAFGQAGLGFAQQFADVNGVEIVTEEGFGFGDTNMTPQATNIGQTEAEAILVFSIPPAASIAQSNIQDLGLEQKVYHSYGSGSQGFIDAAGGAAEGVVLVSPKVIVAADLPDSDPQKAVIQDYLDAGNPEVRFAVDLWDSVLLLEAAISAVGTDPIAIQQYLETEVVGFVGAGGIRTFTPEDHTGLGPDSLIAALVIDNGFKLEATAADLYGE